MGETVTCWGNPDLVSCKNPARKTGKMGEPRNTGKLGEPRKEVRCKNHCYKPNTVDGLHVSLSWEPRRISKLGEILWKPRKNGYMKETEMCVELQLVGGSQKNW